MTLVFDICHGRCDSILHWAILFLTNIINYIWKKTFVFQITAESAKLYDTVEFDVSSGIEQKLWPKHCVQETWGSELHPDLKVSIQEGI